MSAVYADRMLAVHKSFVREILKVTVNPDIISFAGGLPNPRFFPIDEIAGAALKALNVGGAGALQYSTTEGYLPLREYISRRYTRYGLNVGPENILITTGSQQGLDLIGKVFLNKGDRVLVERPTYLAAIQSFGMYEPVFDSLPLLEDGVDVGALDEALSRGPAKIFYAVPNFQNPTGITYSNKKREEVAKVLQHYDTVFCEDDPYGELRFKGEATTPLKVLLSDQGILLGSFSKIISPGLRLGFVCASDEVMEKLIIAKQAADLHTNSFSQMVAYNFLTDCDIESHIQKIRAAYGKQRDVMVKTIEETFPPGVKCTRPEGGMFLWVTLPDGVSSLDLFSKAIDMNVAFVPGQAFYANGGGENTLRLNFSNSDEDKIVEGINRLAKAIKSLM